MTGTMDTALDAACEFLTAYHGWKEVFEAAGRMEFRADLMDGREVADVYKLLGEQATAAAQAASLCRHSGLSVLADLLDRIDRALREAATCNLPRGFARRALMREILAQINLLANHAHDGVENSSLV